MAAPTWEQIGAVPLPFPSSRPFQSSSPDGGRLELSLSVIRCFSWNQSITGSLSSYEVSVQIRTSRSRCGNYRGLGWGSVEPPPPVHVYSLSHFWVEFYFKFQSLCKNSKHFDIWPLPPVLLGYFHDWTTIFVRRLQSVLNAAARLTCHPRRFDHISDALACLHWLRVPERIEFKIAVLTY